MTVRVKQKHLILIPQHHWSPTASYPPPPSHPPLPHHPHYAFCHHYFWKFSKNWKEVGNNTHHKHMVLRFETQITCPHRGQQRLCTWQWTKIKIQWQLIWPYSCLKEMEHMKYSRKRPFGVCFISVLESHHFKNWKRQRISNSELCISTFPTFQTFFVGVLGSYCRKRHDVTVTWPFENIIHRTNTVKI